MVWWLRLHASTAGGTGSIPSCHTTRSENKQQQQKHVNREINEKMVLLPEYGSGTLEMALCLNLSRLGSALTNSVRQKGPYNGSKSFKEDWQLLPWSLGTLSCHVCYPAAKPICTILMLFLSFLLWLFFRAPMSWTIHRHIQQPNQTLYLFPTFLLLRHLHRIPRLSEAPWEVP